MTSNSRLADLSDEDFLLQHERHAVKGDLAAQDTQRSLTRMRLEQADLRRRSPGKTAAEAFDA